MDKLSEELKLWLAPNGNER